QKLHGSYNIWDLGDRPSKLLADIQSTQARNRKLDLPPAVVHKDTRPPAPSAPTSPANNANSSPYRMNTAVATAQNRAPTVTSPTAPDRAPTGAMKTSSSRAMKTSSEVAALPSPAAAVPPPPAATPEPDANGPAKL